MNKQKMPKRWLWIGGLSATLFLAGSFFQPTVVLGQSMSPTLSPHQMIWVDRTYYLTHPPKQGEVVVFQQDGQTYVKRIYRAPGEMVYYFASDGDCLGMVRPSGVARAREICKSRRVAFSVKQLRVPDDCVYVLGDNVNNSEDSRELGPIPIKNIIGRARLDRDVTMGLQYELSPGLHARGGKNGEPPASAGA